MIHIGSIVSQKEGIVDRWLWVFQKSGAVRRAIYKVSLL